MPQFSDAVFVVDAVAELVAIAATMGPVTGPLADALAEPMYAVLRKHNDHEHIVMSCCVYFHFLHRSRRREPTALESQLVDLLITTMATHAARPYVLAFIADAYLMVSLYASPAQAVQARDAALSLLRTHVQVPALLATLLPVVCSGAWMCDVRAGGGVGGYSSRTCADHQRAVP